MNKLTLEFYMNYIKHNTVTSKLHIIYRNCSVQSYNATV